MKLRKKRRKTKKKKNTGFSNICGCWFRIQFKVKKKERFCLGRCKETQREDTGGSISYKS